MKNAQRELADVNTLNLMRRGLGRWIYAHIQRSDLCVRFRKPVATSHRKRTVGRQSLLLRALNIHPSEATQTVQVFSLKYLLVSRFVWLDQKAVVAVAVAASRA